MIVKKRTLAIVAFTTLVSVSCTGPSIPASTPLKVEEPLRIYTTTAVMPLVNDLTSTYSEQQLSFETRSGNYRFALNQILDGKASYFVTNHLPLDSPLWAAPIAQDGIAVVVHPDNKIPGLTLDELRAIYQGRVGNWRELGGPDLPLTVISREDGSGTRAEFEGRTMGTRPTTTAARIVPSSAGMIDTVSRSAGSIGYVSLAYLDERVHALPINGVSASQNTIRDNSYPLRSTIYVVGNQEPTGALRTFIGWIQSPEGQAAAARRYSPLVTTPYSQ